MVEIFTNKKIWKKIVVTILVIMAFQIINCIPIYADDDDKSEDNFSWGGVLMKPVMSLIVTIGDGLLDIMHHTILGQQISRIPVEADTDWLNVIKAVGLGVLVAVTAVVLTVVTAGVAAAVFGTAVEISALAGTVIVGAAVGTGAVAGMAMYAKWMPDVLQLPIYSYSAEEIFKGNIELFNVDFFSGGKDIKEKRDEDGNISYYYYIDENEKEVKTSPQSSARMLRGVVSGWYTVIRNICIVGMLSVLVYVGIRMMLTSTASDKAKYKEMFKDWLTGLCLLFIMHYIMAFSVTLVGKITEIVSHSIDQNAYVVKIPDKYDGKLEEEAKKLGFTEDYFREEPDEEGKNCRVLAYPTNLMGKVRLEMQIQDKSETGRYIGLAIIYCTLVVFTVIFTFIYFKRVLYMAFLTMISPLVALTYCIDKLNDGQAQGFNTWLKEYIFNLLIQPLHLLLYYVLVTSAFELAGTNLIYSTVAIFFMIPAEKLLRSMFGFEKAKTPPSLVGAAAGASFAMGALGKIRNGLGGGDKEKKRELADKNKINFKGEDLGGDVDPIEDTAGNVHQIEAHNENEDDDEDDRALHVGDRNNNQLQEEQPERTREDVLEDIAALEELEPDMVDEDNLDYLISERERLDNELASFDNQSETPESVQEPIRTVETPTLDEPEQGSEPEEPEEPEASARSRIESGRGLLGKVYRGSNNLASKLPTGAKRFARFAAPKARKLVISGAKGVVKTAGAATGAAIGGIVSGATTGNPLNAAQGATAGITAGSGVAEGAIKTTSRLERGTVDFIKDSRRAIHGDDPKFKEKERQQKVNKRMKDPELRNTLSREFGEEKMEAMMESGGDIETYIKNGVEKPEEMIALQYLQQDEGIDSRAAVGTWKLQQSLAEGKDTTTYKDRKKLKAGLNQLYADAKGEAVAGDLTDTTMRRMDTYSKRLYH